MSQGASIICAHSAVSIPDRFTPVTPRLGAQAQPVAPSLAASWGAAQRVTAAEPKELEQIKTQKPFSLETQSTGGTAELESYPGPAPALGCVQCSGAL